MSDEFVAEVLGEIELTKEVILRHLWVRDFLLLSGINWLMCRQWEPGDKIQVVWQHKPWAKENTENE